MVKYLTNEPRGIANVYHLFTDIRRYLCLNGTHTPSPCIRWCSYILTYPITLRPVSEAEQWGRNRCIERCNYTCSRLHQQNERYSQLHSVWLGRSTQWLCICVLQPNFADAQQYTHRINPISGILPPCNRNS